MKFVETDYDNKEGILKFPDHYVAIAVQIDDDEVAEVNGKKIIKAGTPIGGIDGSVIEDDDVKVEVKNEDSVFVTEFDGDDQNLKFTAKVNTPVTIAILNAEDSVSTATVSVTGDGDIVVTAKDNGTAITSTAAEIKALIEGDYVANKLVDVEFAPDFAGETGDGSGVVEAVAETALEADNGEGKEAEGIIFHDTDVTHGNVSATMIIHGFIDENKIPTIADSAKKALSDMIVLVD